MNAVIEEVRRTSERRADRSLTFHYLTKVDIAFARQHGLSARTLCGRWITPNTSRGSGSGAGRVCKTCDRIYGRFSPQEGND